MTWLKVDDKLTSHSKWVPLSALAESLWLHAAVWCAAHNNDGFLPEHMLHVFAVKVPPRLQRGTIGELEKAGLWKRRPKSKGGGWEINSWLDFQPSRQQVKERAKARAEKEERDALHQWLHKTAAGKRVKAIVSRRDGRWCRYCGEETRTTPGDRRSPHRLTHDLTDPTARWELEGPLQPSEIERVAELWVIACGWCNSLKQSRTYEEAGMELLPAPGPRRLLPRSVANSSGTVRDFGTERVGSEQDGTWSGLGGAGLDGSGLDDAGQGGQGRVEPERDGVGDGAGLDGSAA